MCYFARSISDVSKAQPEVEGAELRWFTKEELERNEFGVVPDVQAHALAALKELAQPKD